MDNRFTRRLQATETLKALEAARAKRMQRVEEAARERKAAPGDAERRLPRAEVKLAVAVLDPDGTAAYGWVRNVSEGGCYAAVSDPFPVGTACTVRLNLPADEGGGHLELPATVARLDEGGMGLAFAGLTDDARQALERLVADFDLTLG
jgi:hypothetical protein